MLAWFKRRPEPQPEPDFVESDVAGELMPGGTSIEVTAEDWLQARTIWRAMGFRSDRFNQRRILVAYIAHFRQKREPKQAND